MVIGLLMHLGIWKARNGFIVVVQIRSLAVNFSDFVFRHFSELTHLAFRRLAGCPHAGDEIKRMLLFVIMIETIVV